MKTESLCFYDITIDVFTSVNAVAPFKERKLLPITMAQYTLEKLKEYADVDLNEADTRHQLIDVLLHDVLNWPRTRTKCEQHVSEGFADYILIHRSGDPALVIEAKRTGSTFQLPPTQNSGKHTRHVRMSELLTDATLAKAINQVRNYAIELGCEYSAATNGKQWILFRAFSKGKDWKKQKAFVIQSIDWFVDDYTAATNILSIEAIEQRASLGSLLANVTGANREIYYPKERINNFTATVTTNRFARYLRPLASRYFQNLEDAEEGFFQTCYVRQREFESAFEGLSQILKDSLTPYMEEYGIQQTEDNEKGGRFGNRIIKSLRDSKSADVVVLFGGKGIGKSTFLRRLLLIDAPQFLAKHAIVVRLDLLNVPDDVSEIRSYIWRRLVEELDVDRVLGSTRENLLLLFEDRFEIASRQTLVGIDQASNEYNLELNRLVAQWKGDYEYCALRLVGYWKKLHRGIIVIVDNTDQFRGDTQDFCFTLAQQLASHLDCLSLISMREERFQRSRVHGVLDAFQNSGYHLSAPLPPVVFLTRLRYVRGVLSDQKKCQATLPLLNYENDERQQLVRFLDILINEFKIGLDSPLYMFLVACAHGNIRLALELFRGFLISGYTNINEMVDVQGRLWTLKVHQVVRPLMTPHRFFYEEQDSPIPNLFQLRSKTIGSHFTALRILRRLARGTDPNNARFTSVSDLSDVFIVNYGLADDFRNCLDALLKYSLIEANNRLDEYSDEIDLVRITQYGLYLIDLMSHQFTYLDLICTDCGIYDQTTSSELADYGNEDYRLFRTNLKMQRVETRINKVRCFINYLKRQEAWELDNLGILGEDLVAEGLFNKFEEDVPAILRSARRNVG